MNNPLFIGNLGAGEIIVIALIVLLLFGGKKIPELMKGIGKGVRSFKEGMNNIEKDIEKIRNRNSQLYISRCLPLSTAVFAAFGVIYKSDPTPTLPQGGRWRMLRAVGTKREIIA